MVIHEKPRGYICRAIYPIQYAEIYRTFDKDTGGGVLMYGLPGTGKTMIAKAIAHETGAKFFSIRFSDIVSKWFGEAEKNIKKLFETAQKEKFSVIFFDEFESIASKRGSNSSVMPRIVGELLSQIQGFSDKEKENALLLLAATNRPWDIDSAFLRSGRFSELLYIPLPDFESRKYVLLRKFKSKPVPIEDDVDFEDVAQRTDGFNGADVAEFCDKCKEYPIKRCIQNKGNIDGQYVTKSDIEETPKNFHSSVQKHDIQQLEKFKLQYDSKC